MAETAHPDGLRCLRCGSTDVVCHGRPHGHECRSCGYDDTQPDPLTQALALLRSHADVCSRYGEPDRLRTEADRIEALADATTGPAPETGRTPLWTGKTGPLPGIENGRTSLIVFECEPGTEVQVFARSVDTTEGTG